jgi:C-terminal processing protease CtpA/Prc
LVAPSGAQINKQGVQPDVEAELTLDDLQRGDDPQLLRAVEILVQAIGPLPVPSPAPAARP